MAPQTILLLAAAIVYVVDHAGAQYFGYGRYGGFEGFDGGNFDMGYGGWRRGDAEWLPPADDPDDDEVKCPGKMTCKAMGECRTLRRGGFRTYCGWVGGPLVCCPAPTRRQAIQKQPTRPVQPPKPEVPLSAKPAPIPQPRCGLLEGKSGSGFGNNRILSAAIGGVPLRTARSSPWMVAVGERVAGRRGGSATVDWYCGGSLISEGWVLTAAHCATRRKADVVRMGELDFSRTDDAAAPRDVVVAAVTVHPEYRAPSFYHDLALLRLRERVTFSKFVQPVCLPQPGVERNIDGAVAMLTGWGHTEFGGERSDVLREVGVNIVPNNECEVAYARVTVSRRNYPSGITQGLLCAGDTINGGKDACQGDSGGPLVVREGDVHTQVGVVSSGVGCGSKNFPGVYVRVSSYAEWVRGIIQTTTVPQQDSLPPQDTAPPYVLREYPVNKGVPSH